MARAFCQEGAKVVLAAEIASEVESLAAELKGQKFSALAVPTDVRKEESVSSLFQKARKTFGELDILVNNAGVMLVQPITEMEPADWDNIIHINLRGPYLCSREALKQMIPQKKGVILNVTSNLAHKGFQLVSAYCASKFGLEGFTQAMAMEVADQGIRVNAIRPGGVAHTYMGRDTMRRLKGLLEIPSEQWDPADTLCEPAIFLASDEGANITGQSIDAMQWKTEREMNLSEPEPP
jgi:NAD(P)-dependent dehydrogenase (short-subunit alcohol dehydrogenase family)